VTGGKRADEARIQAHDIVCIITEMTSRQCAAKEYAKERAPEYQRKRDQQWSALAA
jgi:hypothetical protein